MSKLFSLSDCDIYCKLVHFKLAFQLKMRSLTTFTLKSFHYRFYFLSWKTKRKSLYNIHAVFSPYTESTL